MTASPLCRDCAHMRLTSGSIPACDAGASRGVSVSLMRSAGHECGPSGLLFKRRDA